MPSSNPNEDSTVELYDDLVLLDSTEGPTGTIFALKDGTILDISKSQFDSVAGTTDDVILIDGEENRLAWVAESSPLTANILNLEGVQNTLSVEINATVDIAMDEQVFTLTGTMVDYANASITGISFDNNHLVAEVNLTAVNRLIMVNLDTGEQRILGDPLFPVANPSIGYGHVAWQHQQFLNSLNPEDEHLDWDVSYHVISENRSYPLHVKDQTNQTAPQVMESHIAWLQEGEKDGDAPEVRIFSLEETFEPYSSTTMQVATILLIPMLTIWMIQRQKENERRNSKSEEE